jgi:hypothetical protein
MLAERQRHSIHQRRGSKDSISSRNQSIACRALPVPSSKRQSLTSNGIGCTNASAFSGKPAPLTKSAAIEPFDVSPRRFSEVSTNSDLNTGTGVVTNAPISSVRFGSEVIEEDEERENQRESQACASSQEIVGSTNSQKQVQKLSTRKTFDPAHLKSIMGGASGDVVDVGSRRKSFFTQPPQKDKMDQNTPRYLEGTRAWLYIHPDHTSRLVWDLSSMVLILLLIIVTPFELCFLFEEQEEGVLLGFINWVSDIFFIIDIFLNCCTGFYKGKGASSYLVTSTKEIMNNYARGWLWVDLIATFPVARIVKASSSGEGGAQGTEAVGMLRALKVAKIARILKVIRVLKLGGLMQAVEEQLVAAQSMTVAFQLLKLTVIMLLISHCSACLWFAAGFWSSKIESFTTCWLAEQNLLASPYYDQYVASFYFSITTGTTVGYGDISASNTMEQLVGCVMLICAVAYIGHFGQGWSSHGHSQAERGRDGEDQA